MVRFPEDFKRVSEVIASFDSTELASGLGFERFWLLQQTDNTGTQKVLIDNNSTIAMPAEQGVGVGTIEHDFDTSAFNLARTVKGTATCNLGYFIEGGATGLITIQVKKWDGTTETDISTAVVLTGTVNDQTYLSFSLPCTETIIAQGESLRVSVKVVAGGGSMWFGTEPTNTASTHLTSLADNDTITSSNINIPFKIE